MRQQWSERVDEAAWIAVRQPPGTRVCTVPTGYDAYARLLHPIRSGDADDAPGGGIRWADLAAWSGEQLTGMTPFWRIALPESPPKGPIPGGGWPASDVLGDCDGRALARILRGHTAAPDECWFGIWDGYGWMTSGSAATLTGAGPMPDVGTMPMPAVYPGDVIGRETSPVPTVLDPTAAPGLLPTPFGRKSAHPRPVAELPGRDYLLYPGPAEAGLAPDPNERELADLWWPADRSWFVYGDVDLSCTYVAGPAELIDALLASADLEAIAVDPDQPVPDWPGELPEWFAARIDRAVSELRDCGHADIALSRFTAAFDLGRNPRHGRGLSYQLDNESRSSGWTAMSRTVTEHDLRRTVISAIVGALEG